MLEAVEVVLEVAVLLVLVVPALVGTQLMAILRLLPV
jgi:hypothetical protein